jgi:EpsI family protein
MPKKSFLVSLALLAGLYLLLGALERGPVVVAARTLSGLPTTLAGCRSSEFRFEDRVMKELDPDDTLSRQYAPLSGGRPIVLYVGYYGTAKGGRTGHNPYACYPGAGWAIVSDARVEVSFGGRPVKVNQIVVRRGSEEEVVLFWYQTQGENVAARGLQQNLNRLKQRLLYGRDDGAFVRLSTESAGDSTGASRKLRRFAAELMPQLSAHWPLETEVGR